MHLVRYTLIFLCAVSAGFFFVRARYAPAPPPLAPIVSGEQIATSYRDILPFTIEDADAFFHQGGKRGVLFVYRSDCAPCDAQWQEIAKLSPDIPLLAVAADDSVQGFAASRIGNGDKVRHTPYYLPPSRLLTLRTWLRDHRCRFTGALPFVALTDGKGQCAMAWQGLTASTAIEGVANYVENASPAP